MGVPEPISIHAPLAGCDDHDSRERTGRNISIHAPLMGCDLRSAHQDSGTSYFNPRTPYGVRPCQVHLPLCPQHISIHAPLAGCDDNSRTAHCLPPRHFNPRTPRGVRPYTDTGFELTAGISIHAPLAGCDRHSCSAWVFIFAFQSTHPLRGATLSSPSPALPATHFNPRTPCGVRQREQNFLRFLVSFQSTRPSRGATSSAAAF